MITEKSPKDWRELQSEVTRILTECGMQTELEKTVTLTRGEVEVDVVAVETVNGRTSTIFCECKLWKRSVPKSVIHGFRTVVEDGGANIGYVITSSNFQRGALAAADLTNLRLLTWPEFQAEFQETWIKNHLRHEVTSRLDELIELVEPLLPQAFHALSEPGKEKYLKLREKYWGLGAIAMMFTTYSAVIRPDVPDLPLRGRVRTDGTWLPDTLLDAAAYGDFLDILTSLGEQATAELRAALHPRVTDL